MAIFSTTPAVPVLQSDTFEIERQKINNMATDLMNNTSSALPRAWGYFRSTNTGIVTIVASYNIASIVRTAEGKYTITFTTALPSTNYMIIGSGNARTVGNGSMLLIEQVTSATTDTPTYAGKNTGSLMVETLDLDQGGKDHEDGMFSFVIYGN